MNKSEIPTPEEALVPEATETVEGLRDELERLGDEVAVLRDLEGTLEVVRGLGSTAMDEFLEHLVPDTT